MNNELNRFQRLVQLTLDITEGVPLDLTEYVPLDITEGVPLDLTEYVPLDITFGVIVEEEIIFIGRAVIGVIVVAFKRKYKDIISRTTKTI
jgi:hypothetical protein